MKLVVVLCIILSSSCWSAVALTSFEKSQFNETVKLVESGDVYMFFSSGYPPHEIDNSVNPNAASVQNFTYNITINPVVADGVVHCTSLGPIGFATNGVAIYNALTGFTTDAVKNEVFDDCKGHSSPGGSYHYHQFPVCVGNLETVNLFIGIALDGHPIYGPKDSDYPDKLLTSADLDLCHGRYKNGMYRYHITADFPYIIGCYRAEPAASASGGGQQRPPDGQRPPPGGGQRPPQRLKRQTQTVVCTNSEGSAELCDCTSGQTYKECHVASSDSSCPVTDDDNTNNDNTNTNNDNTNDSNTVNESTTKDTNHSSKLKPLAILSLLCMLMCFHL